jgi:hypothetical protein
MRKLIISKTMLFIFILIFINLFIASFGSENTLIGVTVITATLMLLERDLTISTLKNTLRLLAINVFLGLLSFIAIQNMLLGIICNFVALFIIGYIFSYDLRSPLYIAFGLQYLFMVTTPISIEQLPLRMLALISGAFIIMAAQILFNKNKLEKTSNKLLVNICKDILQKVNLLQNMENETCDLDLKIDASLKTLKKLLYDNRKKDFFITHKGVSVLNIIFNFERISDLLNKYKYEYNNEVVDRKESLYILQRELEILKEYINENVNDVKFIKHEVDCIDLCEFYDALENIYYYFDEYKKNEVEKNIESKLDVPHEFKMSSVYKRNLNINSVKFSYSIKVAIGVSIAGLIMDYFKLSEGRWIMFTVFSLIQPYSENCITKSKKRIFSTIIGGALIFVLFSILKDASSRGIVILLAGYISTYTKDYRELMICNTISAIGAACISSAPNIFIINRIAFVLLGTVIALVINKLVLPYNAKTAYKSLIDMYKNVITEMSKEINLSIERKSNLHKAKNLLLISNLIEDKILSMNSLVKDDNQDVILSKKRLIINNMYSLYLKLNKTEYENIESIFENTGYCLNYSLTELEEAKDIILENIDSSIDRDNKIIYKNLLNIIENNTSKEEQSYV